MSKTAAFIETIKASPVEVIWESFDSEPTKRIDYFEAVLPNDGPLGRLDNSFNGQLVDDNGERTLEAWMLQVNQKHRKNGIGERLTRTVGILAAIHDCEQIEVDFKSVTALSIFGRVFGEQRLSFFETDPTSKSKFTVPMNLAAAVGKLELINSMPYQPGKARELIQMRVDTAGLDVSGWEIPVEIGSPSASRVSI